VGVPRRLGISTENAKSWRVTPLALSAVSSSWFDDANRFPRDSIRLDSALVMRGIDAEWTPVTSNLRADVVSELRPE
jgi:hypothetical protein